MAKFERLPKRIYTQGKERKMLAVRLPSELIREIEGIARDRGWTMTDVVQTALDSYAQWHKKRAPKS